MPIINIDDLCEPIEVVVGGKKYTVTDISRETAKKMEKVGKEMQDSGDTETLIDIMTEVLDAKREDVDKLGVRKLLMLVKKVMGAITDEVEGKNAPEVVAAK